DEIPSEIFGGASGQLTGEIVYRHHRDEFFTAERRHSLMGLGVIIIRRIFNVGSANGRGNGAVDTTAYVGDDPDLERRGLHVCFCEKSWSRWIPICASDQNIGLPCKLEKVAFVAFRMLMKLFATERTTPGANMIVAASELHIDRL